jgi:peroxiredoxin
MTTAGPELDETVDERPHRQREWSGAVRSVALPLLIVAAIVGVLWYLEQDQGGGGQDGYGVIALDPALNPSGRPPAAEAGRVAPDFRLEQLGGGDLRLSDLRGRPVVLNFWATWCTPCRTEMPEFVRLDQSAGTDGPRVVAVDLQEAVGPVQAFVDEFGMRFPTLFDRSGAVARAYRVNQLPVTVIIDREGIVRATRYGPVTPEYLAEELARIP